MPNQGRFIFSLAPHEGYRFAKTATLENDQGYVTSSAFSPSLGHTIGLALVKHGPERIGEKVIVWNGLRNEFTDAVLCNPVFIDADNEKLHA